MALRDQPYIPLMIKDFMTDEKLSECSAEATGVYIKLMCLMHKSDEYGTILLQQKYKQTDQHVRNFAIKLQKHLSFSVEEIERGLQELLNEGVLKINNNNDKLLQKRMVKDNSLSLVRASSGSLGGFATAKKSAKDTANTVTANASVNGIVNVVKDTIPYKEIIEDLNSKAGTSYRSTSQKTKEIIKSRFNEGFTKENFLTVHSNMVKAWLKTTQAPYLRPITLYSNKFESYLNFIQPVEKESIYV